MLDCRILVYFLLCWRFYRLYGCFVKDQHSIELTVKQILELLLLLIGDVLFKESL